MQINVTSPRLPFEIIREPGRIRERADDLRRDGMRICVVPTMGFLHEGHLSLLRAGRARSDALIMTLFVNPTQFGADEDLAVYPRDLAGDLDKARSCGVDLVFAPDSKAMYPAGYQTYVTVEDLSRPLCGASRPDHFRGVASVVTKLFHLTLPHVAIFGRKDFQQLALIRRMVRDLDFAVEIVGMPIVREDDGLAMSSRNAYLSPHDRTRAVCLYRSLQAAQARFKDGERDAATVLEAARAVITAEPAARIDYLELRDAETLESMTTITRASVLAMAVFFGKTRLLDNAVLAPANVPPAGSDST